MLGGGQRAFASFLARRTVNKKSAAARSKELNFKTATGEDKIGITKARSQEWKNWTGFDAVDVLNPNEAAAFLKANPEIKPVPTRWVDTNKAQPWEPKKYKARIVVRGDLEKDGGTRTDSPTCSNTMLNMTVSLAACKRWKLHGGDITASFLQGEEISRTLVLQLPADGIEGVAPGSIMIAKKPVYGTRDAPRGFWRRLHRVLLQKGLQAVRGENACYVLVDKDSTLRGMVISHVDDLLWTGDGEMDRIMAEVQSEFKFGALTDEEVIEYCGRIITQGQDGIHIKCPNTASKTRPIWITSDRKAHRGSPVTEVERSQLRSVIGSLSWVTRVCRPDIAYQVHKLQTKMTVAVVDDLLCANNLLKFVKESPNKGLFFAYGAFDFDKAKILSFTDASHAADFDNSKNGKLMGYRSQSGRILALGGKDFVRTGKGKIHILDYHSNIIRRVCRSTLQAETLSMVSGYDEAEHIRHIMHGIHGGIPDSTKAMDNYDVVMFTDCRSLEEHLRQAGLHSVGDKRLATDLCSLRQVLWRKKEEEVGDPLYLDAPPDDATTAVVWIETKTMLADGLTKSMRSPQLHLLMDAGEVSIDCDKSHSKKASLKAMSGDMVWSQKEF